MFGTLLVAVIVMRQPCADNVARFVGSFEPVDAGAPEASPGTAELPPGKYVRLAPGMSEDEIRKAIGQEPGTGSGSGSAPGTGTGTGSAQ